LLRAITNIFFGLSLFWILPLKLWVITHVVRNVEYEKHLQHKTDKTYTKFILLLVWNMPGWGTILLCLDVDEVWLSCMERWRRDWGQPKYYSKPSQMAKYFHTESWSTPNTLILFDRCDNLSHPTLYKLLTLSYQISCWLKTSSIAIDKQATSIVLTPKKIEYIQNTLVMRKVLICCPPKW